MEGKQSQENSALDRMEQGFDIGGIFREYLVLKGSFNLLLEIADEYGESPKLILSPRSPLIQSAKLPAPQSDFAASRVHWLDEFQGDVFSGELQNKGLIAQWQRLKIYRWVARKIGPILGVLAFFFVYFTSLIGTDEVFSNRGWISTPMSIALFLVFAFGGMKIAEAVRDKWPLFFQEAPKTFMPWDEIVEIVRSEAKRRRSRRFTGHRRFFVL